MIEKRLSPFRLISAADVNATVLKAAAGQLHGISAINISDTVYFLKIYDKATAPTEADIPVFTFPIPASATGNGFVIPSTVFGAHFQNGIGLRVTAGHADNDVAVCAAGAVFINGNYR